MSVIRCFVAVVRASVQPRDNRSCVSPTAWQSFVPQSNRVPVVCASVQPRTSRLCVSPTHVSRLCVSPSHVAVVSTSTCHVVVALTSVLQGIVLQAPAPTPVLQHHPSNTDSQSILAHSLDAHLSTNSMNICARTL